MAVIYIRVTHKIPICNAQQQQDVGFFSLHATKQSETDDLLYFLGKKREGFPTVARACNSGRGSVSTADLLNRPFTVLRETYVSSHRRLHQDRLS